MAALNDRVVREIALDIPGAVRVLQAHHLDYCCGGARTLRDACAQVGASLERVTADIENEARHARARGEVVDVVAMSVEALVDRIVNRHHALVVREEARLRPLARTVVRTHGDGHVELRRTAQLVDALFAELLPHQQREERVLFPHIVAMARAGGDGAFSSIEPLLCAMEEQHESMAAWLDCLRASCDGFRSPSCACASWRALYVGLEELERDLVEHVHLENNVLFPRARELEAAHARR